MKLYSIIEVEDTISFGEIQAVLKKLGGTRKEVKRFLSGKTVIREAVLPRFKVWKTLVLGAGPKTADELYKMLEARGHISGSDYDYTPLAMKELDLTISETMKEVRLIIVPASKLCYGRGALRADLYRRAKECGLSLCPAEVGPLLRLEYLDQPLGEVLRIGMVHTGGPYVFSLVNNEGRLLLRTRMPTDMPVAEDMCDKDGRWVFMLPELSRRKSCPSSGRSRKS